MYNMKLFLVPSQIMMIDVILGNLLVFLLFDTFIINPVTMIIDYFFRLLPTEQKSPSQVVFVSILK